MAIIHCGGKPGGCGRFSDAVSEHDIEMAIPIGTGSRSGNCYVGTRDVRMTLRRLKVNWTMNGGIFPIPTITTTTNTYLIKGVGHNYPWALIPFFMGVKAKLVLSYNSKGHLIATLKNIRSTVLDGNGSMTHQGRFPYCTAGDFGFALVATLSPYRPADRYSGWNKCFGGWWSGARSCNGSTCYAGCTYYRTAVWNDFGSKYSHSGSHPTRRDNDFSWDLGVVSNPDNYNVFLYGRAIRGNCNNARFDARDGASIANNFPVPPMNICPPTIDEISMTRDICESKVFTNVTLTIPELGVNGVDLYLSWAAAETEAEALAQPQWQTKIIEDVAENTTIEVPIDSPLIPNTKYYFKAYLTNGSVSSDTVVSCGDKSLYMPASSCAVPLLTTGECEALMSGDCLPELTEADEEVCCG